MGKNKGTDRALTQEQIWDDSALVQSWDEAVEEYKLYHSIAAKGENVEDVLREAEAAAEVEAGPSMSWAQVEKDDDMADVVADAYEPAAAAAETHVSQTQAVEETAQVKQPQESAAAAGTAQSQAPTMPYPAFPQTQDEGLKNLMMAWYYAGYYTALYQEQQRANGNGTSS
ncbi:hypothetical protein BDW74DRAFT_163907 [Aspergillus multicolor]|uniref:uncharacterized protein n=1 Tax=Aspergillus multicolor TaxID=41759 RepID=UPI003CCCC7EB